ncbi:DUF4352 domain-containing protein [Flexivirga sp. ID2601S]|uniref:DUF4352 domain-containing protein n=1 Tax=Flexivirga aerilata TaxID=1656889 RepID=A0A849ADA7_9MICO|nr:DUF4352 domain-containing protein [Flexivirga aerilata]NNG38854.1 DUF4352 domain-containing protein [Flexivirga aerilata]
MSNHNGQDPNFSQQWGGQPPQGGPYPPVPPGPAPRKRSWFARHKILTGLLALVAFIVVVSVASQGGKSSGDAAASDTATAQGAGAQSTTTEPTDSAAPESEPTTTSAPKDQGKDEGKGKPGVGTAVKSGDLQFTVTKVVRDQASVGQDFLAQKAQGRFTLVYVTVRNVGKESQTLLDSDQKIKDADSKTYSPDTTAQIALNPDNNLFLEQINPGNAVDGVLVYDMPASVRATAIDFKGGGLFDDAETVQLR